MELTVRSEHEPRGALTIQATFGGLTMPLPPHLHLRELNTMHSGSTEWIYNYADSIETEAFAGVLCSLDASASTMAHFINQPLTIHHDKDTTWVMLIRGSRSFEESLRRFGQEAQLRDSTSAMLIGFRSSCDPFIPQIPDNTTEIGTSPACPTSTTLRFPSHSSEIDADDFEHLLRTLAHSHKELKEHKIVGAGKAMLLARQAEEAILEWKVKVERGDSICALHALLVAQYVLTTPCPPGSALFLLKNHFYHALSIAVNKALEDPKLHGIVLKMLEHWKDRSIIPRIHVSRLLLLAYWRPEVNARLNESDALKCLKSCSRFDLQTENLRQLAVRAESAGSQELIKQFLSHDDHETLRKQITEDTSVRQRIALGKTVAKDQIFALREQKQALSEILESLSNIQEVLRAEIKRLDCHLVLKHLYDKAAGRIVNPVMHIYHEDEASLERQSKRPRY